MLNVNRLKRCAGMALCICLSLSLSLFLSYAAAQAQVPTPGEVEETLRTPLLVPLETAPIPKLDLQPPPQPPVFLDDRRIKIERFAITGNTVFSEEDLRAVIAEWEGEELTLAEIYEAADRITDYYQDRGYSLTTATIPAQKMRDGTLRIEVVEGRVGKLIFTGNRRYGDEVLNRHLNRLQPGTILRFDTLEQEVLLLNDLPGLLVRSVLLPGEEYGTSDISLQMVEKRVAASAVLDNHGRDVIGNWRVGADFTLNNPGRFGDVLGVGYTHTESGLLRQGRLSYNIPVSSDGARVGLSYSHALYDIGGEFSQLGIDGTSRTARLQFQQPLIRSRTRNLSWTAAAAHVLGQSDMGDVSLSDDEINFVETGLTFSRRHVPAGFSSISALVATNFRSNPDGTRGSALPPKLELRGSYEHLLGGGWSAHARGEAVIADGGLPDSHKYSLGGPYNARGYVSSRIRGDRGIFGSVELRRHFPFWIGGGQLKGFVDAGGVRSRKAAADGSRSDSLVSAGVGANFFLGSYGLLDLQWAKPLDGKESGDGDSSRFWMTLTAFY